MDRSHHESAIVSRYQNGGCLRQMIGLLTVSLCYRREVSGEQAKTILLVDDSELLLEVARYRLEQSGFAVLTASDVPTVRQLLAESPPDLIVRDVEMPEVPPAELEEALAGAAAPIWLYSALDESTLAARASVPGIAGYVSKNDGIDALVARVTALLGAALEA
jgi:two-component system, OmpR family, KDP operon response regulator KdpE